MWPCNFSGFAGRCGKRVQSSEHESAGIGERHVNAGLPAIVAKFSLSHCSPCIYQLNNYFPEFRSQTSFWTSASSVGLICGAERTLLWCSSGNAVDETIINYSPQLIRNYSDANGNESTAHCVTLGLNLTCARYKEIAKTTLSH
jgi:hypothetical protein